MRILHAASFGNPNPGGFIPLVAALGAELRSRSHEVALVVPDVPGATWHATVRDAGIELFVRGGVGEVVRTARRWRPDVAHIHFFGWEPFVTAALWLRSTRIFWHAHSTSLRAGRLRRTVRSTLKFRLVGTRVERFVSVSDAIAAEIARLGAPPRRIVVIPNEVDTRRFRSPRAAERLAARNALGIDGPAILFFGRDPQLKGTDILCAALAQVPGMTVVTVATPAASCTELSRVARVVPVERAEDVVPLMWATDLLAMPSRGEGMSFAQREAQLTGLPLVASDLPALRENALSGVPAHFFEPENPHALAAALREALTTPRGIDAPPAPLAGPERWAARIATLYEAANG